jgi:hypothetical protein
VADPVVDSTDTLATPKIDAIAPADPLIETSSPSAPLEETSAQTDGISNEDITLFGGLAAALAAVGLGVGFASRRRRKVGAGDEGTVAGTAHSAEAPQPVHVAPPVLKPFATAPAAAPVAAPIINRPPVMARNDASITDPLFSTPITGGPITDPMFAPRNDVEVPISDPLFAKHDRFAGHATASPVTLREKEVVN